jgi:hypothetical protein
MTEHPLAVVRSTEDLRKLFRQRVADLNISLETLDEIAGLPTRYCSKLLAPHPHKNFGAISFEALLGALALQLVALEDAEALDRVRRRLVPLQRIDHNGWRAALNEQPVSLPAEQIEGAAGVIWRADREP